MRHVLRDLPALSPLTEAQLEIMCASVAPFSFAEGDEIVTEGCEPDGLYFLLDGEVQVAVGETVVTTLGRGDIFGERSLLSGSATMDRCRSHIGVCNAAHLMVS